MMLINVPEIIALLAITKTFAKDLFMTIRIKDMKGNVRFVVSDDGNIQEKPLPIQEDKQDPQNEDK